MGMRRSSKKLIVWVALPRNQRTTRAYRDPVPTWVPEYKVSTITVHRLKFSRWRHKHRKWITFSVFLFSFLCVSSKMLNFNICCVGSSQWSGFASRFFSFLQVRFFFNGLDCSFNNEDSPTSIHSLSLEFHIYDLFHISIQIVCQRLSLVIHI